jgi:protein-disulfide isomerase
VLGIEPEIIANHVQTGQVKLVFWPVLNHGNPSLYSTLTSECVGQQDPALFWDIHAYLFEHQGELWRADRDYYVNAAVAVGAEQSAFEACYDGPDGIAHVKALDAIRRQRNVFNQPTFDVHVWLFTL